MTDSGVPVLVEGFVVQSVAEHLRAEGWEVTTVAHTAARGDDLSAVRGGRRLRVEAKGAGSSREGTRRYGSSFTASQVTTSVGLATWKAVHVAAQGDEAGVAFPDNAEFHRQVDPVIDVLDRVPVTVFWVSEDGSVRTGRTGSEPPSQPAPRSKTRSSAADKNPSGRSNDPGDEEIIWWLLEQPGGNAFSFHALFEALREQPAFTRRNPEYAQRAIAFADRYGVVRERSGSGRGVIHFRLLRD